jgi:hypothetical protein
MTDSRRGGFWWWSVCWASLAAVTCAYLFFWSTFPVTMLDEPPGPGAVMSIGFLAGVGFTLNAICSIPLLLFGLIRLRRTRRLVIAWSAVAVVGVALEVMVVSGLGVPQASPVYVGPAVVAWAYLAESAGYLIVGAAMARIATAGARTSISQVGASLTARPLAPPV